jgi:hypothetical protein
MLQLKVKASTDGVNFREVVTGHWSNDGSGFKMEEGEGVPYDLLDKLNRYFRETGLSFGTIRFPVGQTTYEVAFTGQRV